MLYFYTGIPGSGKSYHLSKTIFDSLQRGKTVFANLPINTDNIQRYCRKPIGHFFYISNDEWLNSSIRIKDNKGGCQSLYSYLQGLKNYALMFHKRTKDGKMIEHQSLLVLDEAQDLFNSRTWNRKDRLEWVSFFRLHRHYGYDVVLVSQDDKSLDKQLKAVFDTQVHHRKISRYKKFGKLLKILAGGELFMCIESLYDMNKRTNEHLKSYIIRGTSKYYDIYDSYIV